MTSRYSTTEPGQPCVRISATGVGAPERTCRKWIVCPSISVVNCGYALRRASSARQSNDVRQCSAQAFTWLSGDAVLAARAGDLVGPPGAGQPVLEVVEVGLRDVDAEGLDGAHDGLLDLERNTSFRY